MRLFCKTFALLLIVALPLQVFAYSEVRWLNSGTQTVLSAVALNASAGTRTFTITNGLNKGMGWLSLQVQYTYSAATTVTLTCQGSIDQSSNLANFELCADSSGVCTSSDRSFSRATAGASAKWLWLVDVRGADDVSCVLGGANAGAGDLVTVKAKLIAAN